MLNTWQMTEELNTDLLAWLKEAWGCWRQKVEMSCELKAFCFPQGRHGAAGPTSQCPVPGDYHAPEVFSPTSFPTGHPHCIGTLPSQ